jgi:hypothetical protein
VKRTWSPQEDDLPWYVVCFQSGFESQGDAYAADSYEVMATSMTHSLEGVHLGVDTNSSAALEVLKFCTPGSV